MPEPLRDLEDSQLEALLQEHFEAMSRLTVQSKVPPEHKEAYQAHQSQVAAIEEEQAWRRQQRPTIADQDTTELIW
jgi:hypothetical protein